jgi:N6-adenosine-specific RNA methylase IME4/uncharacterized ParB-like nuclease family protein
MPRALQTIALSQITVPSKRARQLRPDAVAALAQSIKAIGLLNPITVVRADTRFRLVAGRHRLEAMRQLGEEKISARVTAAKSALEAELAEIDENLMRAELSPAERAAHHARRKTIYEELHPDTKPTNRGGPGRAKQTRGHNGHESVRYTKETAAKTGQSERTVRREASRGAAIADIAALAGTSLDKGDELDALAKLGEVARVKLMERAVAGEKVSAKQALKKERRAAKETALASATAAAAARLGRAQYGVIYADPPWRYEPWDRTSGMDRAADNHYPTMTLEQLVCLRADLPAARDCVLFLWATTPMLADAIALLDAWGFDYRSHLVWAKDKTGTGYWARNQHELLLIAVKGDVPPPAPGMQPSSLITAPRGRHSEKPAIFAELIAEMFPALPRVELFARATRDGWASWGNEVGESATVANYALALSGASND